MIQKDNYAQYQNLGMDRNSNPFNVTKGKWKMILNADIDKIGQITKRMGYKKILNTPDTSEVLSLIPYEIAKAGKLIMINAAGKAYATATLTVGSGTWGTAIKTALSTTARWGWAALAGWLFLGNGVTSWKTDSTAFTAVSGLPVFKYATTLFQRLYCAGVSASKSTLFWSETGDGNLWSIVSPHDSGSEDIEKDWKGDITALGFSNDRVIILKDKMIKRWDTDYMKTVMSSRGIVAPHSISDIEGMLMYLDRDGILMYNGEMPTEISSPIQDLIYAIDLSATNLERICGETYQNKYYLSVGTLTLADNSTIPNAVIVYDFNFNTFVIYSLAHHMTAISKLVKTDGTEKLYMGDINGNVYEMFNGNDDDGTGIEMRLETDIIYPYDGGYTINPKLLTVVTQNPNDMKIKLGKDYGTPVEQAQLNDPVENLKIGDEFAGMNGWVLTFEHNGVGRPTLLGYSMDYELTDKRI